MRKLWYFWNEEEVKRFNTKRQQIIHRELYKGLVGRTRAENKERLKEFKKEFGHII